jgi:hypothetical protein
MLVQHAAPGEFVEQGTRVGHARKIDGPGVNVTAVRGACRVAAPGSPS